MAALILLCVYAGIISFLVHRLKQIQKYPKKFDKIPGYEEYCKSIWYWPTYKPYRKGTSPEFSTTPACGATFIILISWHFVSTYLYHWFIVYGKGGEYLFISNYFALFAEIIIMMYDGFLSVYLSMFSKRPAAICFNLHTIFRKESRSTAWEKMTKLALLFTIMVFPVRVMTLYNYGYVNSEKLVYNSVLSFREHVFEFDNIDRIEVIYNEDGSKVKHCYIYNGEDKTFDLVSTYSCVDDNQFEVIDYVEEHLPEELQAELQEHPIK